MLRGHGEEGSAIQLWDVATGVLQQTLEEHDVGNNMFLVAFSSDSRRIASSSPDVVRLCDVVRLWDTATGALKPKLRNNSYYDLIAFLPNLNILASDSHNQIALVAQLWDMATGTLRQTLTSPNSVSNPRRALEGRLVAFSPNSRLLVFAPTDGTIELWDTATGMLQQQLNHSYRDLRFVTFSPDSRLLASADWGGLILLWYVVTGKP
ncbi:YVTN repeat-like/Quino protein amine dehydrogenase [Hyaloscypha bicolor E]|uniref:Mitochondrial division protein 1 n=1 Tax=Hyaloscypha bicolor E TaxID=1095630 RepID=A0A2J6SFX7_9HELO|nr:YVTN repeat-like/Quino protein amine dehydrogenase [Hyaloscypha bicolor E]PMD49654.1 YVTN repeat-like/Quino protein amine dehydrogenase [Hyaloscypha bicolor E]